MISKDTTKMITYGLIISLLFSFSAYSQSSKTPFPDRKNEPKIEYVGIDKMPDWTNLIQYNSFQEQLKNLDFKQLKSSSLSDNEKEFMTLFLKGLNGDETELIDDLKKKYSELEDGNIKNIITQMLLEYLNNQGRYKEGVDFLGLEKDNFNTVIASLPDEAFFETTKTVHDSLKKSTVNHAMVKANINGHLEEMLFDTGADWTMLSESRAKSMGVLWDDHEFDLSTSTSIQVKAKLGYIKDFKIGNVHIKNHHVLILNDESTIIHKDSISFDAGAVFGWNGIRKLNVVLDDVRKKYTMVLSKRKKETLNNFFWIGYPGLKVVGDNGQALAFGFDSGANETEISYNFLKKIPNLNPKKEMVKEGGIGGVEETEVDVIENVSLYLSNHKFTFKDLATIGEQDFFLVHQDGTIGMDILNENIISIDFLNKELKIENAPSVKANHIAYYSTLALRESPYADFKGVVRLAEKEARKRNHYRFEYDNQFRLKSISFMLGNTLINPNHTSNYFFTSSQQRFTYEDDKEIRTFYDRFGNQVMQRGAFKEVYTLDNRGRYASLSFEDDNGSRIENAWGIYEYSWEQQTDGSVIENRVDKSGQDVSIRPSFNFYTIRLCYHQNGLLAIMQNIDNTGKLVENSSGVAQDQLHFDKQGRWLGWTVLDADYKIKRGNGPNVAIGINETDKYGYERSIRYEDIDGSSIINAHGFWGSKRFYDQFGNYDYTQFLDKDGNPGINEESGYSIAKYSWSKDGRNRTRIDLLGLNNQPVLHKTRGYASIKQEYNKDGNVIKTSFLGLNNELINRKDNNIAYIIYEYDDNKKLIRTNKFKKDGSESK